MNRIENIIDNCMNCQWFGKYLLEGSNTDLAYICQKTEMIILLTCSKDTFLLDIPDFCTLPETELPKINRP